MANPRYIQTDQHSFFGDFLYDQIVPENYFLSKLDALVNWSYYTKKLTKLYKGEGLAGRPAYDPALLLRCLLISYLYDLSERQTEVYLNENLPAKWFVGLAVDEGTGSLYFERVSGANTKKREAESIRRDAVRDRGNSPRTWGTVWHHPDHRQRPQYSQCQYE